MANFLVTGELGFVGSHFTEELYCAGHDMTEVLDHLRNGHQSNLSHLKNKITLYISNVEKIKSIILSNKFYIIFHLATHIDPRVLLILFKILRLIAKE